MSESISNEEMSLATLLTSPKRRKFAVLYAQNGGNGTAAAEGAGYATPAVEACRLIKDEKVLEAISRQLRAQMVACSENRDTIIARETLWANSDIRDYFNMVPIYKDDGSVATDNRGKDLASEEMKPITTLTKDQAACVKKISWNRNGPVLELHDPMRANRNLAEYEGMLDKDMNNLTPDDAASLIAAAMDAMDSVDDPESS